MADAPAAAAAREAFAAAVRSVGESALRRSVAGHTIEVRVAGEALRETLTAALPPADDTHAPDLTVLAWDARSSGVGFPLPETAQALDAGHRDSTPTGGTQRVTRQPLDGTVTLLDGDLGALFVPDATALPSHVFGAPLLHLLTWWLADHGLYVVHGSCVGNAHGAALLVGPGGSGKSTSALACLGSPLGYISDDYTVVTSPPDPRAKALYYTAKLHRHHLTEVARQLRALPAEARSTPTADKAILMFESAAIVGDVPLRALVLPRVVAGGKHRVIPVRPGDALGALAPSTILQLHGAAGRHLTVMRQLCETLPAYLLELGPDLTTIPAVIETILQP